MAYLCRDVFTTARVAGSLDHTNAEPGPGKRHVTDVESVILTTASRLRGGIQATPVWNESAVFWSQSDDSGFARGIGRTLYGVIVPEDPIFGNNDIAFGFATALAETDPTTDGLGVKLSDVDGGDVGICTPGLFIDLNSSVYTIKPSQYLVGITLDTPGAVMWISTFDTQSGMSMRWSSIPKYPQARIIWKEDSDATTPLFPYISFYGGGSAYPNGHALDDLRLIDISDWTAAGFLAALTERFTRVDSNTAIGNSWTAVSGTWGITSNKAYCVSAAGGGVKAHAVRESGLTTGDGFFQFDVTMPDVESAYFYCFYRYQDADNYYRVDNNYSANEIRLIKRIAGTETSLGSTGVGINFVAGQTYRITVVSDDTMHKVYVDNVQKVAIYTSDLLPDATKIGIGLYDDGAAGRKGTAGQKYDNVLAYPITFTLPGTLRDGVLPLTFETTDTLISDTFTDTNGVHLLDHTPDTGTGPWEDVLVANNPILNNRATLITPGAGLVFEVIETNRPDTEVKCDLITPAAGDTFAAGIVCRWED